MDHTMTTTSRPLARPGRPRWLAAVGVLGAAFGVVTVVAASRILFGSAATRAAEGDYVPFVLWFNFLAGFAYLAAGAGLVAGRPWAARLALAIALATAVTYVAFGVHVLGGGRFTMHTVKAMALRTGVWAVIAALACRSLGCRRSPRAA